MKDCQSCNSKISDEDVFCPYCGAAQVQQKTTNEKSFEDDLTIAVSETELSEFLPKLEDYQSIAENSSAVNEIENNAVAVSEETYKSESASGNDEAILTDKEADSGVENFSNKVDDEVKIFEPESNRDSQEAGNENNSVSVAPRFNESQRKDSVLIEEQKKTDLPKIEPDKTDTQTVKSKPEEIFAESSNAKSEIVEDDFSATMPYTLENIAAQKLSKTVGEDQLSKEESIKNIEIPEEPLKVSNEHKPQFDSVRIMRSDELDNEKLTPSESVEELKSAAENQEGLQDSLSSEASEQSKIPSKTSPNFEVSDTDGKKRGSKLKSLSEGTILHGRYEIVRKIGGGGMGAVYLATDRNLGGILRAVKEMVQSYIEETAQDKAVSDFKRESMLLTSLDHPAIPTIYDYFYDEKEARFYLVMKYISGGDLASRLRSSTEGRLDEATVTEWAIQIADVLDYLHNRQPPIVYRDLKPSNIMIDGNSGRVMLIDFGIARWINKEEKGVTAVGTMGYAPPELFSGNVESRSDIYSLGSTMFHLLTGADPQNNPLLIFDFQKHPRPRQINSQLSDQMEKILMRAVEYSAENRFKSAAEMKKVLTAHLESLKAGRLSFGIAKTPPVISLADQNVFCGFCGQKIVATDMFCAYCGSRQPMAQQGINSAEYTSAPTTAKLMIVGTQDLDTPVYNLVKDENLLGRRDPLSNIFPEIDLSRFDPQTKVSRRHAKIWRNGTDFVIEDLGSSNGTIITRTVGDSFRLVPHQPHTLVNGEKLKVGDTTLHFVVG